MDTTDQPNSICHIQSIHMYTLQPPEQSATAPPPFLLLSGEMVIHSGSTIDGQIVITNYRLYLQNGHNHHYIPLGLIESIEIRDLFFLQLYCKDARTYKCTFENNESALQWHDKLLKVITPPRQVEQMFAFYHCIWAKENGDQNVAIRIDNQKKYTFDKDMFESEMIRMHFHGDSWRITKVNENYKLCPTYPPYLLVPSCIDDNSLECVAKFRSSRRIPAAVWRHTSNGAIIARCSQPEVGWLGWRSCADEDLLKAISEACNFDHRHPRMTSISDKDSVVSLSPGSLHSEESELQITGDVEKQQEKKLLIMDARSYATAFANRARGGGCEYNDYYPNCEIQFMNLANIHSIRKSFHALRVLCMSSAEQTSWFSSLENTRWLLHMSGLMKAAVILATTIETEGRPVLVHCSDGWDRTPQIVALGELLLDPYYRTVDGFRVLIEREWLAFGHKFADRCGQSGGSDDFNERCPVFLQWLDCVHQLLIQFPISFEFTQSYLIKLVQHTYSNFYGTFLCNTQKQRSKVVWGKTFSIWEFLELPHFKNHLYTPPTNNSITLGNSGKVLWPKTNIRDLHLWTEVYLGSFEANFLEQQHGSVGACPGPPGQLKNENNMSKTRSYGDLVDSDICHVLYDDDECNGRRNSDPNIKMAMELLPNKTTLCDSLLSQDELNGEEEQQQRLIDLSLSSSSSPLPISPLPPPQPLEPGDSEDHLLDSCNQDCIFNKHNHSSPMSLNNNNNCQQQQLDDLLDFSGDDDDDEKTKIENGSNTTTNGGILLLNNDKDLNEKHSILFINNDNDQRELDHDEVDSVKLENKQLENNVNINNNNNIVLPNGNNYHSEQDSSSSKSVEIIESDKNIGQLIDLEKSVETSTETLVSEQLLSGHSPKEYNGFEKIQKPCENYENEEICRCNDATTAISPSNGQQQQQMKQDVLYQYLEEDGLLPLKSPIQDRLNQILEEQRRKVELLELELHTSRQILIKQACHRCHANGDMHERQDDINSVAESLNSTSEGRTSAGAESLRSDLSWVAVEEGVLAECQGTLWVPDHAVTKCTGCGTEFWLGRRRHHCRKCGRIFCADCSEHATPLPSEQLYNPVRVCSTCYLELKCSDNNGMNNNTNTSSGTKVPVFTPSSTTTTSVSFPLSKPTESIPLDRCKRMATSQSSVATVTRQQQQQRLHPQIAASSN